MKSRQYLLAPVRLLAYGKYMTKNKEKSKPIAPLDLEATPERLLHLVDLGLLNRPAWRRAQVLAGHTPTGAEWLTFGNWLLAVLGVASILTGAALFAVANWGRPPRLVECGGTGAIILLVIVFAFYQGLTTLWGKTGLLSASLLTGVLLALINQDYQIDAAPYRLFLGWAIIITVLVIVGRWGPLGLLWLILLNLAAIFYWEQATGWWRAETFITVILLNGAALLAWEWGSQEGLSWLHAVWVPRFIAFVLCGFTVVFLVTLIYADSYDLDDEPLLWVAPFLSLPILAALWYGYQNIERDLFMLALDGLALIIISAAVYVRIADKIVGDSLSGLACLAGLGGLLLLGEIGGLSKYLLTRKEKWDAEQ